MRGRTHEFSYVMKETPNSFGPRIAFSKIILGCLSLAVPGLCRRVGLSVVVVSRGCSVAVVHELLAAVASLVAGHGL